jgi:hypothetical protein
MPTRRKRRKKGKGTRCYCKTCGCNMKKRMKGGAKFLGVEFNPMNWGKKPDATSPETPETPESMNVVEPSTN